MKAYIHNFRRIHDTELTVSKITLLAGANYAGKTSIAQAIGAVLAGQPMPWAGLLKKDSLFLVNDDAKKAFVRIENDTGNTTIKWPGLEVSAEGITPPQADAISAGLKNIFTMGEKDRAKYFTELLGIKITELDFRTGMSELGDKDFTALWKSIDEFGWDIIYIQVKDKGARLKGRWEQVTGQNFGKKKADGWQPVAWTFDLEKANLYELEAGVTQAKELVEVGITDSAVEKAIGEKELTELKMKADVAESLSDQVELAKKAHIDARSAHEKATRDYEVAAGNILRNNFEPCPICNAALMVVRGHIVTGVENDPKAIELTERTAAKAKDTQIKAYETMQATYLSLTGIQTKHREAEEASKKLAEIKPVAAADKIAIDIVTARARLAKAEERLAAFTAKHESDGIFKLIEQNAVIVEVLAPDGLRLTKLQEALTKANAKLDGLSKTAHYDSLVIQPDMSITYGGRPHSLWWGSEQYRAKILMTQFIAQITGADCVIFDGAEILDGPGRSGMFQLIQKVGIPALICMTLGRTEWDKIKPVMVGAGVNMYWLNEGAIE